MTTTAASYKVIRVPMHRVEFDRSYRTVAGNEALERMLNDLAAEWDIVAAGTASGDAVILKRKVTP